MKIEQPATHLDHMIRQTRQHHMQLSSMADLKSNALLTIASIVITLSIRNTMIEPFKWAAIVLIVFCLMTVMLASYATMPKMRLRAGLVPAEARGAGFNLLFFGDFVGLGYDDFEDAMKYVMKDPDRTYEAQIKDIYMLGRYLADKKYRFLRAAYLTFMTGIVTSGGVLLLTTILN